MPVTDNDKDRQLYRSISGDPNPPLDNRIDNFEDLNIPHDTFKQLGSVTGPQIF